MMEDPTRPGMTPKGPDGRPGTARAHRAPSAPIQDLKWLRQRVLERLDALEALARRREAAPAPAEIAALERALRQGLAEVEEARRRIRAEAERQEKEWSTALTQLEADRRRLAEAWERVEQQRIEAPGASEGQSHPHAPGQWTPRGAPAATLHAAALPPARAAATDPDPYNPVAQAILREFQALSRDVRCNAEARRNSS
jgi:hypothetical protein